MQYLHGLTVLQLNDRHSCYSTEICSPTLFATKYWFLSLLYIKLHRLMPMTTGYKIKGITGRFSLYFSNISELSTYNMRKKNWVFLVVKSKFRLTVLRVYSFSPSFKDVQYTHFDPRVLGRMPNTCHVIVSTCAITLFNVALMSLALTWPRQRPVSDDFYLDIRF